MKRIFRYHMSFNGLRNSFSFMQRQYPLPCLKYPTSPRYFTGPFNTVSVIWFCMCSCNRAEYLRGWKCHKLDWKSSFSCGNFRIIVLHLKGEDLLARPKRPGGEVEIYETPLILSHGTRWNCGQLHTLPLFVLETATFTLWIRGCNTKSVLNETLSDQLYS